MLKAIDIVSIVILLIMMLILGNTIAMGVRERTREYGVLRALGFSPRAHAHLHHRRGAHRRRARRRCSGWRSPIRSCSSGMGRFLEENMGGIFPYFRVNAGTAIIAVVLSVVARGHCAALHPGACRPRSYRSSTRCGAWVERSDMIPINYNIRNLAVRKTTTAATALGLALVVFVLAAVLMLSNGIQKTLGRTADPNGVVVLRKGATPSSSSTIEEPTRRAGAGRAGRRP